MLADREVRIIFQNSSGSRRTRLVLLDPERILRESGDKQEGVGGFETFRYRFEYDKLNRLTKSYDPGDFASTFTYDARNLVTAQDALSNKRIVKYDELNRNIEINVEYAGTSVITTKWEYDKNGRLTKLIDPRSKSTTYAYDALDRLTTETYHDATTRAFGYNVNSNIVSAIDQNATSTNYFYDVLNRLTQKTFDVTADHIKGETTQVDFTYDALNRLLTASDSDSDVAFTYNTLGLVESEQMEYGGISAKTVYHDYDDQGRRTKCRYPGSTSTSGQLEYTYDTLNRLSKIDRRTGTSSVETLATWTFKGPSRVIKKDYGNGTWCDVSYNTRSLVGSVIHKKPDGADVGTDPDKIFECVYSYDDASRVKSEALVHYKNDGTVRQDAGFAYHYDKANRLTKLYREVPASALSSDPPPTHSKKVEYTFDASSNRQTVATTPSGGSVSNDVYTTNDTNSYTAVNFDGTSVQYEFDAAGSRTYTNEGAKYWYYDYQNHVVEIRLDLEQEEFVAYDHDALGRRFAKHYDHDGLRFEANKVFYFSGAALIQEYDIDENDNVDIEVEYFWGQHQAEPVHIRKYNVNSAWTLTQAGYYHQNAQGSVYAISGTSSPVTLVENYRYTEYGGVTVNSGDTSTGGATPFGNKWAWQCGYYDFEITNVFSGLALYGHGHLAFDPELGKTISQSSTGNGSFSSTALASSSSSDEVEAAQNGDHGLVAHSPRAHAAGRSGPGSKGKSSDPLITLILKWKVWVPCTPSSDKCENGGVGGRWHDKKVSITLRLSAWRALSNSKDFDEFKEMLPKELQEALENVHSIQELIDTVGSISVTCDLDNFLQLAESLGSVGRAEEFLGSLSAGFKAAALVVGLKSLGKGKEVTFRLWKCNAGGSLGLAAHTAVTATCGDYTVGFELLKASGGFEIRIWGMEGAIDSPWGRDAGDVRSHTPLVPSSPGNSDVGVLFRVAKEAYKLKDLADRGRGTYSATGPNARLITGDGLLATMNCHNFTNSLWTSALGIHQGLASLRCFNNNTVSNDTPMGLFKLPNYKKVH